jgi:hypothetical protein
LGVTEVKVKTNDSELKKLEFEFATTNFGQVEKAIALELSLSTEDVQRLIRYQAEN